MYSSVHICVQKDRDGRELVVRVERMRAIRCRDVCLAAGCFCVCADSDVFELALWRRGSVLGS